MAERTPLIPAPELGAVRLKAEHLQPVGAFKIRGAWTAVRRLPQEARAAGVVTSSSGNHGYALAWAAHRMGIRCVVVMPENAPQVKQQNIAGVSGEVRLIGAVRGPEQTELAHQLARDEGFTFIAPYDNPDVISGQATCTLEILEDWPEVTTIAIPTGGGGLLAGACQAVRRAGRDVRIVAIEPEGVPKLSAAIAAGRPVDVGGGTSLADGLLTRSIGDLTWPLIRDSVTEVLQVTDAEIRTALRWLGHHGHRVEPSGAVTTAAVLAGKLGTSDPTALVLSGGNVDPDRYRQLVSE